MLKLGIIGWGYWGRNYAKYLDTTIDASLDLVCDLRKEMLQDAKKRYPHFNITSSINDLISSKLDGVIIATPASTHYSIAQQFVKKKIPLLIEKPITNSLNHSKKLVALCEKHQSKILVGHTFIYNSAIEWIKLKIDKRYFGKVYYFEFKRQSYGPIRDDVNIIWDFAPHDISMITWFMNGVLPVNVNVVGKSYSRNNREDIAVITLEYPKNILVTINVAWLYPLKIRQLTLLGSEKMAVFDDTNNIEPIRIYNTSLKYPSEKEPYGAAFRLGNTIIPRVIQSDPLYNQIKHFVDYIKDEVKPKTPVIDGYKNTLILAAISESLKKQKSINFGSFTRKNV